MTAKIIVLILCFWPTIYEALDDKYGEKKKDKLMDGLVLVVASICISALCWFVLDYNPLSVLLLLLAIRFAFFDYLVNALLKRYSEGHKDINIWSYLGNTTHWWDQLIAKVNPWVRLIARIVVLVSTLWFYLS